MSCRMAAESSSDFGGGRSNAKASPRGVGGTGPRGQDESVELQKIERGRGALGETAISGRRVDQKRRRHAAEFSRGFLCG